MPGIVFLFPGQGSQYVGMGRELAERYPEAAAVFTAAREELGWPVDQLCFNGPEEELVRTENTQPALLTVSTACFRVLEARGIRPAAVAGHSLGEYSALVAAGSLAFRDALQVVARRGRLMANAFPAGQGGMVAVLGLPAGRVVALCREVKDGVAEAANFNSPGQVVVAGDRAGLEAITALARAAGAKRVVPLQVSGPFHSSLMEPVARELATLLNQVTLADPAVPVVANVTADYAHTAAAVRENLRQQVASPVRWEESMGRLLADGYRAFVEVGPGNVLSGLLRRLDRQVTIGQAENIQALGKTLALLQEAQ
ncbi:ACP S-malonyltransferase [Moorella sp. Hama-1]|uniref:ACP S-malonyltransferase n=1 Tax=Moorella sp. Hama-1 TaxID=2138101 RepID=UPI000D64B444|nr:ACP S-malonyltransferase [Moorella sp. Hama-1]MDN5361075.1 [acyl-carrier-protein] S-malonyltransferase [Moorella sp. (in: firmicutes)]BCV21010.1 malonyl CoA-acyl carrier protein transacylase [Moorella sp. Hama-1]